jgi:hypothetical protein
LGVLLTDGVGEIELAAAFRPYTELSYAARPLAVTVNGAPVRSRHGLTFAPRATLAAAGPLLDRLVVPGADAARRGIADRLALPAGLEPAYLHAEPGFAFDGVLRDLARIEDVPSARWVAKTLQYPAAAPPLTGAGWPWEFTLRPVLIAVAAALAAAVVAASNTRPHPVPNHPDDPRKVVGLVGVAGLAGERSQPGRADRQAVLDAAVGPRLPIGLRPEPPEASWYGGVHGLGAALNPLVHAASIAVSPGPAGEPHFESEGLPGPRHR